METFLADLLKLVQQQYYNQYCEFIEQTNNFLQNITEKITQKILELRKRALITINSQVDQIEKGVKESLDTIHKFNKIGVIKYVEDIMKNYNLRQFDDLLKDLRALVHNSNKMYNNPANNIYRTFCKTKHYIDKADLLPQINVDFKKIVKRSMCMFDKEIDDNFSLVDAKLPFVNVLQNVVKEQNKKIPDYELRRQQLE